jgi:putative acetyltransferase
MLIRDFRPGEEAGLRRVFMSSVHELASGFYTKEQLNAWAPHAYNGLHWAGKISSLRPFVAVINGRIAGYADLQASGYIDHFFVSGQFSGRGVGSALIGHIHQAAAQRKISGLSAHVSLSAESFFGKHGFSIVQRQSVMVNGVSMDNALMSRKLQPDIAPNPDAPRAPVSLGVRPP